MTASNSAKSSAFDTGMQRVGGIYAKALLAATEPAGKAAAVLDELDAFVEEVLDKMPQFDAVLSSALIAHEDKAALLDKGVGGQASPLFLNFLKVVSSHGRLDCLRVIRHEARRLYDAINGHVRVDVITATPLDEKSTSRLSEKLRTMFAGRPDLVCRTDPEIIGGIVMRVGDTVYDGSIATQLKQIRGKMLDRSVHEIQSRRDRFRHPAGN